MPQMALSVLALPGQENTTMQTHRALHRHAHTQRMRAWAVQVILGPNRFEERQSRKPVKSAA